LKLQKLPHDSTACDLIRIFDFDITEARSLHNTLHNLQDGLVESISVHKLPFVTMLNGFKLTVIVDDRPRNPDTDFAIVTGPTSSPVIWRGSREDWRHVCELVEPFTIECSPNRYQWLTDDLGAPVLFSPSGAW
jgi:hypothetical protein